MPVFIDSSEFFKNSTMPPIEQFSDSNAVKIPSLSQLIGGDALISTWSARPKLARHITRHLQRGALIVEIKRGTDLPGSLLGRANHLEKQALRMAETGAAQHQRMVLYTGEHFPAPNGLLRICTFDGRKTVWQTTKHNYEHFRRAKSKLMDSGLLRWEGLKSNLEIPIWFADKLRHLAEYQDKPVKTLRKVQLPFKRETFRELTESEGAEAILALFNDLGPVGATHIMNYIPDDFAKMAYAVEFLTNSESVGKVKGIGQKTVTSFRTQFGLVNDWDNYRMKVVPAETQECLKHDIFYYSAHCPICLYESKNIDLVQFEQGDNFISVYDRDGHRMYYKCNEIDVLCESLQRAKKEKERLPK